MGVALLECEVCSFSLKKIENMYKNAAESKYSGLKWTQNAPISACALLAKKNMGRPAACWSMQCKNKHFWFCGTGHSEQQ